MTMREYVDEDGYTVIEIETPYPLGVPNRVQKELDAMYADWAKVEEPCFTIHTDGCTKADRLDANELVGEFLLRRHVPPELISRICAHVLDLMQRLPPDAERVEVGWCAVDGWYVRGIRKPGPYVPRSGDLKAYVPR